MTEAVCRVYVLSTRLWVRRRRRGRRWGREKAVVVVPAAVMLITSEFFVFGLSCSTYLVQIYRYWTTAVPARVLAMNINRKC